MKQKYFLVFVRRSLSVVGLLIFISTKVFSANYFLANNGLDTNNGTSSLTPWQTITHLNLQTLAAGDTVFFKCGDTFRGTVNVHQSGTAAARIVFTSYGSGAKPIISGAEIISGWNTYGNFYRAATTLNATNFFSNNKEMIVARYPNEGGYCWLDNATTTSINDAQLSQAAGFFDTAKVCIHTAQWCWEKANVTSHTLNHLAFSAVTISPIANYGYFLYNKLIMLDTAREWYADTANNFIYFKASGNVNPNTLLCEATVYNGGIHLFASVKYISVNNISFEKQFQSGVQIESGTNRYVDVSNCDFIGQYNYGVQVRGKYHHIYNCYFESVDGHGIDVSQGGNSEIDHNVFHTIGMFRNSGIGGQTNCSAIAVNFNDSVFIHHNNIDSAGYCGISADGAFNLVEKNIAQHCMLLNNDGAPFKSYGALSHNSVFRNNIAFNTNGNTEGTNNGSFKTPGLYFDNGVNHCTMKDNTVYNCNAAGIFLNSGSNGDFVNGNTVYGSSLGITMNGAFMSQSIWSDTVKKNIFFPLSQMDFVIKQTDTTNGNFNFGIIDSNYYFNPYTPIVAQRYVGMTMFPYTLAAWQTASGFDLHTKQSFVSWTSFQNYSQLFVNPTDNDSTINLGTAKFLDLDSVVFCGSFVLHPYTSKILLNTQTNCPTNVNEFTNDEFQIYPNPASDELNILFSKEGNYTVKIFDEIGREVFSAISTIQHSTFNIEHLSLGIYFIKIISDGKISMAKFVKK